MQARKSARIFKLTIHGFTSFMLHHFTIYDCLHNPRIVLRLDGGLVKWFGVLSAAELQIILHPKTAEQTRTYSISLETRHTQIISKIVCYYFLSSIYSLIILFLNK